MKSFIMLFVFSLSLMCYAQQNKFGSYDLNEVTRFKSLYYKPTTQILKPINLSGTLGLQDTLFYLWLGPGSNFGFYGQDWMLQWFKAPADLNILGLGFFCTENQNQIPVEVKIVKINWNDDSLYNALVLRRGYYQAIGNGYNDITAFLDNPDRTGGWVPTQPDSSEPFGHDLWSNNGVGYSFIPDPTLNDYQWIETNFLGNETYINQGEIFGVAVKNTSARMDSDRVGFLSYFSGGFGLWKFYANGRLVPGEDYGWWTRDFGLDFRVAVDICGDCNPPPSFNSITVIPSGTDIGPFTVNANITDANGSNPSLAGVASAKLYWTNDAGVVWHPVPMTGSEPNFSAIIPEQIVNTSVEYYLEATDFQNQIGISTTISFRIFGPSGANTLVVYNGYYTTEGYPQNYLFGPDIHDGTSTFAHDTWAYGQPPSDLFEHYSNIFEICNGYPEYYLDSLIGPWLAAGNNRNYYLEGQEWLGSRYNYVDKNFVAGDFEFDVLGINASFNDVSYANSTGQLIPSKILPQALTLFGQPLLDKFATYVPTPDSIQYDPIYEGNTGDHNWIDGFNVESDVIVDVLTESRGIAGVPNVQNLPCAMHRTLPNGNKIFFASYWTLYVNTSLANYHWLGFTNESPAYQNLLWFGIPIITDVENAENTLPTKFALEQNYPNPFNPVTTIKYTIPNVTLSPDKIGKGCRVILKVYDILGKEIATLVNEEQSAGTYEVLFNQASSIRNLASGIYFYQLKAGSYIDTKKMILIK